MQVFRSFCILFCYACSLLFSVPVFSNDVSSQAFPRLVTVDWTVAETLIALGAPPVGMAQTDSYRTWVQEPALPANLVDIGLRSQPNRELLVQLKPDRILISPMFSMLEPMLSKIAPVSSIAMYHPGSDVWADLYKTTRSIAKVTGKQEKGEQLLTGLETYLSSLSHCLKSEKKPFIVVQFIDDRHVRVYGKQSLFDAVMQKMGLRNAWLGETNYWGFSTIGIEKLAAYRNIRLIIVEPVPVGVPEKLAHSQIWSALPVIQQRDYLYLPPVWSFGGIASAHRFATELSKALNQSTSSDCPGVANALAY